jgi:polyhydroxybutyrate depolymerase
MRKLTNLLLLIIAITLSACSVVQSEPSPTITPTSTPPPPPTSTPEPTPEPTLEPTQTLAARPTYQPEAVERMVMVDGMERSYLLHVPPELDPQSPAPLVFAFHGYGGLAKGMQYTTRLDVIADRENFIVVYPQGLEFSWNTGWEVSFGYATINHVNEATFIREILSDLGTITSIDPQSIYATGFSMGAMAVYRLGCEMSDTFAAIAPVAGVHLAGDCNPSQAVSVIHIHGLSDTAVEFSGGGIRDFPPVEEGIEAWVELNQCTGSKMEEDQENGITHVVYASCESGSVVELYTLDSWGHDWPWRRLLASEVIWAFFEAHPMP